MADGRAGSRRPAQLPAALAAGSAEAGVGLRGRLGLPRARIRPARHIEVQLLGDATGRIVAIGERDCSLQRRHQKLVEEAPAPGLTAESGATSTTWRSGSPRPPGCATPRPPSSCVAPDGAFYFLEVNTRLQVEHGVSELVAGIDMVQEQFCLAAGEPLSAAALAAATGRPTQGHAIEVRLSAEDPSRDFAPARAGSAAGSCRPVPGPGRHRFEAGDRVAPDYDNLLAKVMVHAGDRPAAIDRLRRALDETEIARHPDDPAV